MSPEARGADTGRVLGRSVRSQGHRQHRTALRRPGPQAVHERVAIGSGHADITHDQVGMRRLEARDCFGHRARGHHAGTLPLQHQPQDLADVGLVVHDEDGLPEEGGPMRLRRSLWGRGGGRLLVFR